MLGRAAHGEVVIGGNITDSWRVKKDGRLIWADSFRITDEIFPHLHRKALLSDCKAIATLIYFGPRSRQTTGVFAGDYSFPGMQLCGDVGKRTYCRPLCRERVL